MNKKLVFIFPMALLLSYFLIYQGIRLLNVREDEIDKRQTRIIQEHVKDRFNLFLKLPLSLGYIGADYFIYHDKLSMDRSPFAKNLFLLNKDILGLNLVDPVGRIVSVFPYDGNSPAAGKITQNFENLKASLKRNDKFWLSPPFNLFQGGQGFVFYVPIKSIDGTHKGWFAPVISTSLFDEAYKLEEFLKSYNLIIRDVDSGYAYFATGIEPDSKQKIFISKKNLFNRDLEFLSWRKNESSHFFLPWYWIFILSIIPALITVFTIKLYYQRKTARLQLQDISVLLRLTSKEALAKLIDLQAEFFKIGSTENITFVTNLIEQIELLQTLAYTGEEVEVVHQDFLPLLQDEISSLNEMIQKKSLKVTYSPEAFAGVNVEVNSWLLQNCVLSNILVHSIIHAELATNINIDCKKSDDKVFVTFHTQMVIRTELETPAVNLDRRMEVARRAISIYKGELFLQHDLAGGVIIRITLPI